MLAVWTSNKNYEWKWSYHKLPMKMILLWITILLWINNENDFIHAHNNNTRVIFSYVCWERICVPWLDTITQIEGSTQAFLRKLVLLQQKETIEMKIIDLAYFNIQFCMFLAKITFVCCCVSWRVRDFTKW